MYVVFDPNHQIKLLTAKPAIDCLHELRNNELDGEYPDEMKWNNGERITHVQCFTSKGVYIIEWVSEDTWLK